MTTVLIPIYPGVTQLDFTAPHQVFSYVSDFKVITASPRGAPVESHGLVFDNLADLGAVERCDVLCVPGGAGCVRAIEDPDLLANLRRLAGTAKYLTSVCTGSLILAAAGLLKGKQVACHWAWRDLLKDFGAVPDTRRVARDGNIITGGGVTAGIDFALTVVAELRGLEVAQKVQLRLEYAPAPPFESGRPESAPPEILSAVNAIYVPILADAKRRIHATIL
jgi:putative intracellular protease/amidase